VGDTRACCSFGGVKSRHTCGGASTPGTASQMQLAESGNVHEQQVWRTPIRARTLTCGLLTKGG